MKDLKYLLLIGFLVYSGIKFYKLKRLIWNEFGIAVIFDIPEDNIDDFFGIENGTYNKEFFRLRVSIFSDIARNSIEDYDYINIEHSYSSNFQYLMACDNKRTDYYKYHYLNTRDVGSYKKLIFRLVPRSEDYDVFGNDDRKRNEISLVKDVYIKLARNNTIWVTEDGIVNVCKNELE